MPHKGNGAMFIQYFISRSINSTGLSKKGGRSRAFLSQSVGKKLKDLQVHLKVPNHHLLRQQVPQLVRLFRVRNRTLRRPKF